ncbi:MAG: hypothetical protein RQ757_01460 [Pseudomonadales bacterium]|nr:hypothetical protein [Pseudomonadales bacterium]
MRLPATSPFAVNLPAMKMVLISLLCLSMTACLVTVESDERARTTQWTEYDTDRLVIGETSQAWVQEVFGAPRRQSTYPDGGQVWRYENSSKRETEVGIFLLFHVDVDKEKTDVLAIEMHDGIVSDYWTETR